MPFLSFLSCANDTVSNNFNRSSAISMVERSFSIQIPADLYLDDLQSRCDASALDRVDVLLA